MITLPILIVCIVLFAWKEAVDDDGAIDKTNKEGTKFSHYDPDRYIVGMVITMVLVAFSQWKNPTWWAFLYFPITWAVFTISFRFLLNRKRGKHWWYIGPWSNRYDRLWYAVACMTWWTDAELRSHAIWLRDYEKSMIANVDDLHRAGAFAYATEAAVLAISLTIYITKTL